VEKVKCAIVGGSGYTGGELLRLLLGHPRAEVTQVTSERSAGKLVFKAHPNLRKRTQLQFSKMAELRPCDLLFLCLPHGESMGKIELFQSLAPKLIDLSADFRLQSENAYQE
jgi:N-acetyl-gamma-glutamyl-phosphate/LysW-gamma-L-alpha-aminoadipyl-6-phosphate reductase